MIIKGFRLGMAAGAFCVGYAIFKGTFEWLLDQFSSKISELNEEKSDEESDDFDGDDDLGDDGNY